MNTDSNTYSGGCFCGTIRYVVQGPLRGVINCHCRMCQRLHGSFAPYTQAATKHITISPSSHLIWHKTSEIAQRGFCRQCGSNLFWAPFNKPVISIIAGSLDEPITLKTIAHVFVSEKAAFYDITDNLPQYQKSSSGQLD